MRQKYNADTRYRNKIIRHEQDARCQIKDTGNGYKVQETEYGIVQTGLSQAQSPELVMFK